MRLEDILNAPSLSVSLKTATELGFNYGEENKSFLMSDEKKSQGGIFKQKTNINESYLNHFDEDSIIKEHDEEEEQDSERNHYQLARKEKAAINIIDY